VLHDSEETRWSAVTRPKVGASPPVQMFLEVEPAEGRARPLPGAHPSGV